MLTTFFSTDLTPSAPPPGAGWFTRDFDAPDPDAPAAPPPPAPARHTDAELAEAIAAARLDAHAGGFAAGLARASADRQDSARTLLSVIAERLDGAAAAGAQVADDAAQALAGMLMAALGAVMPDLAAASGAAEIAAFARAILPGLSRAPQVTVRVNPAHADTLAADIAAIAGPLDSRCTLMPDDTVPPGDVRIVWDSGEAGRDTAALWEAAQDVVNGAFHAR